MIRFLAVCLGGAIGSGARYLIAVWAAAVLGPAFPWGTLIVNLAGSFLLGFVMHAFGVTGQLGSDLRLALTSGVLGGFTTYSTFNYETTRYFRDGAWLAGVINLTATVGGCLLTGLAGLLLARLIFGR